MVQEFLAKRSELEREVSKIIALDPASLGLVDSQFRRQSQTLNDEQIRKRTIEIDEETQNTMQSRKDAEEKLNALERRIEALGYRLQEIKHGLHKLESVDPANIGIKLHKLHSEWEGMNKKELEKIKTTSEIERLFQEQLLLGFQIEAENREVRNKSKELDFMGLTKNTFTLEKLILQLEVTDRHIKREEPRVLETDGELKKLEIERDKLRAPLEHGRR